MLTEKDYCDYETCVALKVLGYVGICDAYYELTGNYSYNHDSFGILYTRDFIHPDDKDRVAAPLLYQAQKWLREEKGIHIEIPIWLTDDGVWKYNFRLQTREFYDRAIGEWDSYEKALSEGIKEAVKILKENETIHE